MILSCIRRQKGQADSCARPLCVLVAHHPHLLYPQFKQVAHPSMITSALVLHLWHMVALGGKLVPSPVTSMSSSRVPDVAAALPPSRPSPPGAVEGATASSGV